MSSGEDRTHHWLLTSPGPGEAVVEEDPMVEDVPPAPLHYPLAASGEDPLAATPSDAPDEGIVSSPVNSLDLDRDSPLGGPLDDDDDDGPPSIETQLPENVDDLEVSGITSTWISSGGSHFGTAHPGLGYSVLNNEQPDADSSELSEMPGLEPGDFGVGPVYGPQMPGSFSSPVHEPEILSYGDVADDNAVSGICGLRNLGNTCFMAAGIQCLVNTPPIAQYFFSHHHTHNNNNVNYSLAAQFSQLTHKIWCGKYSSLRPADFKDAFGQQWRDFRDYRQHDCQEFVTLLLETLRKQMCLSDDGGGGKGVEGVKGKKTKCVADSGSGVASSSSSSSSTSSSSSGNSRSSSSSSSSTSSNNNNSNRAEGSRGSQQSYSSPSSPQSPHCPTSPQSPRCPHSPHLLKQPLELRSDSHEETVGLDSGAASPKSSVSSSSVDAHLVNLRLQPIPEEVRALGPCCRMNTSCDDLSLAGTTSCHDAESVTSDVSDPAEVSSASVRRYNQLGTSGGSSGGEVCDGSDCDISSTCNLVIPDLLATLPCHSISDMEKNHIQESLRQERAHQQHQQQQQQQQHQQMQLQEGEESSLSQPSQSDPSSNSAGCSGFVLPHSSFVKLEDIMKESKTSNVNVLVKDSNPANNELLFDSEKYAKYEKTRLKNSLDNLCKSGVKRVKEVNLLQEGRCSRVAVRSGAERDDGDERDRLTINKRMRLDEKNIQYELEKSQGAAVERTADSSSSTSGGETHTVPHSPSRLTQEQRQADLTWKSFVGEAKSTVVDTFYGQFRSSLVCSVCGHTSVKYDPFGTLSVPLPYANQIQITVTYISSSNSPPTRYLITLCKVSYVSDLKAALCKMAGLDSPEHLVVAEVFDNHIARIVEDGYMTKFLNYNLRNIYTFHLPPPPPSIEEEVPQVSPPTSSDKVLNVSPEKASGASGSESGRAGGNHWRSCTICLEEMCQTELKTHHTCEACLLCDGCIEMSCKHQGGGESLSCPVCQASLSPSDLIPVERRKIEKPKARILRVPLVFRMDQESDNNNKRCMQLLGHPALLALPSRLSPTTLTQTLAPRIPPGSNYSLLFVDGRGYNCSRCLFSSHCRGCEVLGGSEVVLQAGDTLCVRFTSLSPEHHQVLASTLDHPSLNDLRQNVPLTLYDCLRAFTQSETLEEADSWFCPVCVRKQQATKTISVWRFPPYLILHLERFLFHGTMSTKLDDKVIFPLDGLDLSDYVAGDTNTNQQYNLYACVCHMGVAQAGHYTAFARSPVTGEWHYFNDDSVTRQKPREEEYSTSYLLFYHRQGTNFDLHLPQHFAFVESGLPKTSQRDEEEDVGCSSRASPRDFIGPLPALSEAAAQEPDEGQGQAPVFQINKMPDLIN
ncbi:uncharacterized protein LOC123510698 [Portunus trituberculatus]|uniref:uncharacterized protein LOC123510698 n=1 Tax=Portunus trituberculatus TaxID=210409 RepID=UPI001E1CF6E9|nr:uncharacterized protein LOC123510698 [Portunus trituberculatus]